MDSSKWHESLQTLYTESSANLDQREKNELACLLDKHKDIFSKGPEDLGRTAIVTHSIDTGNAKPIKQPPRQPPRAFLGEEEKIIQKQLHAGVIEESTSAWSSPMVYVRKKDATVRPYVDYRKLNDM